LVSEGAGSNFSNSPEKNQIDKDRMAIKKKIIDKTINPLNKSMMPAIAIAIAELKKNDGSKIINLMKKLYFRRFGL
tara:strand:- start:186 stop:413 length:228 start_codon:yes stop_codon:yes gene_type:complete